MERERATEESGLASGDVASASCNYTDGLLGSTEPPAMLKLLCLNALVVVMCCCGCASQGGRVGGDVENESSPPAGVGVQEGAKPDIEVAEGFKLSASLVADGNRVPATAPILLRVRIENVSDTTLRFIQTRPERDIELLVTTKIDGHVPLTLYGQSLRAQNESGVHYGRGLRQLKAGEAMEVVLHVDRTHDTSLAATYFIHATRRVPRRDRPDKEELFHPTGRISSRAVEVTVLDPPRENTAGK